MGLSVRILLRLVLAACWLAPSRPMARQDVLNWRVKVRPQLVLPNVSAAVARALLEPSSCVAEGGVTLSVTNSHHAWLRPEQFALLEGQTCFMRRMVSVCYGVVDRFGLCVNSSHKVPPSDFRRSNYAALIWAKWRIMADALTVARVAMWLDADVLLLRNPWVALDLLDPRKVGAFDFRHQSEDPCAATQIEELQAKCANVNGGQLVMSNYRLAAQIYAARPRNLTNFHRLDQDFVENILRNRTNGFRSCALPAHFASYCWSLPKRVLRKGRDNSIPLPKRVAYVPLCQRVTHHFNCVTDSMKKKKVMRSMVASWRAECGNSSSEVSPSASRLTSSLEDVSRSTTVTAVGA